METSSKRRIGFADGSLLAVARCFTTKTTGRNGNVRRARMVGGLVVTLGMLGAMSSQASEASVTNLPVANLTTNTAVFNGYLTTGGDSPATVYLLWGTANGGTNWNAWENKYGWPAGFWADNSYMTPEISGLTPNTKYFYTYAVSNACGRSVATSVVSFTTFGVRGAWWENAVLKYTEDTGATLVMGGPHYMSKDESDQSLGFVSGFAPSEKTVLYRLPDLLAASSASGVAPIRSATPETFYGAGCSRDAWRGCGLSDDLALLMPGNYQTNRNTTLSLADAWSNNVTVFTITNNGGCLNISALDFSHDSTKLYSSVYRSTPGPETGKLYVWDVGNLRRSGNGLTLNTNYSTSVSSIANLSVYYIGGKDLIFYGERVGGGKVCMYDPAAGTETVLINGSLPSGSQAYGIMNVKVGGVGLGQMHLYVQCDGGALYIYDLAADGKSVSACIKSFSGSEMQALLGQSWTYMRSFEVLNDETHAFFSHHRSATGQPFLLHVVWTAPTIQNLAVANVSTNQATLNAYVANAGGSGTKVCVLWGATNGGTNWNAWANTNWWPAGAWTNNTYPSFTVSGLSANTTYYYTFGATNVGGGKVASPSVAFTTEDASGGVVVVVE